MRFTGDFCVHLPLHTSSLYLDRCHHGGTCDAPGQASGFYYPRDYWSWGQPEGIGDYPRIGYRGCMLKSPVGSGDTLQAAFCGVVESGFPRVTCGERYDYMQKNTRKSLYRSSQSLAERFGMRLLCSTVGGNDFLY